MGLAHLATQLCTALSITSFIGCKYAAQRDTLLPLTTLDDIDFIFSMGDSYSTDFYDPTLGLDPTKGQALRTTTGGLNWIEYLAQASSSNNTWYDLAHYGATTNNSIILAQTWKGRIPSFVDQVAQFLEFFSHGNTTVPWTSNSTLFTVWFGINDVGGVSLAGRNITTFLDPIFASYDHQISTLVEAGATNFLLMNIPPTDLSPIIQGYGNKTVQIYRANLALWNARLVSYIATLPLKYPGTSVEMFDAHSLVSSILATPAAYGFLNSTSSCRAYSTIINDPEIFLPQCGVPLKAYTWWDGYHVTWRVQEIVAQAVGALLDKTTLVNRRFRKRKYGGGRVCRLDDDWEPRQKDLRMKLKRAPDGVVL